MKTGIFFLFLTLTAILSATVTGGQSQPPAQSLYDFDHGTVRYTTTDPTDSISRIQSRIDSGDLKLKFDSELGYLPALLEELHIPRSSQSLVFSKTSLQLFLIAPDNPRAIYFNDDVYIGSVQASPLLEVASMDPKLGAVFYTLDQKKKEKPQFQREFLACLLCHDTPITNGIPGLMTLSVLTDRGGNVIPAAGTAAMTDRTPFKERFGGWYVTGTHGNQQHWGNLTASATRETVGDAKAFVRRLNLAQGANVTNLTTRFDTKPYLTPNSDIAALMVMTHQTRIHNLITSTRFEMETAGDDPERIRVAVEPLVRGMFFVWEAALEEPITGNTTFARDFAAAAPHDRKGRSLRELDLSKRLLRYPLSYLVYSDQFAGLQDAARKQFFKRAREILTSADPGRDFSHISQADRQAIAEILVDTHPEFR